VSDYKIINAVSLLLRKTLWEGFVLDPEIKEQVPSIESIALTNPAEKIGDDNRSLSLWLYQVQQNEFLRNVRPTRIPDDASVVRMPPLALNLFYLLTPSAKSMEGNQLILGRSMQILHDNPVLPVKSGPDATKAEEEIRISMCHRDLRELAEVWEALQQPYRLSVCYEVRVPRIESTRVQHAGRIADRTFDFQDNPPPQEAATS